MSWFLQHNTETNGTALVIGAMNLDVLATSTAAAIADDSNPGETGFYPGGVGRNIAEGLARLGIDVRLMSVIGNDEAGKQLLRQCQRAGLATDGIVQLDQQRTSSYVAINDSDGGMLYAISDMKILDQMTAELFPGLEEQISAATVCVIDCNLPEELISSIVGAAGSCAVVAESVSTAKCHRVKSVLPSLALLKVNRLEAAALVQAPAGVSERELVTALLAMGPQAVLMTLGSRGALFVCEDQYCEVAAPVVEHIASVNGAGDALLAGLIAAKMQGRCTREALRWGATAAGLSLSTRSACSELMTIESMVTL
ncbi:hypothetical protein AB833_01120 [Chromatiales bacterium (ex Bugula neritina AB1)]|nr:hypothetical protein AB833_01120 [Chromatiales bacterium (ex Bugula neritina AB1)]